MKNNFHKNAKKTVAIRNKDILKQNLTLQLAVSMYSGSSEIRTGPDGHHNMNNRQKVVDSIHNLNT